MAFFIAKVLNSFVTRAGCKINITLSGQAMCVVKYSARSRDAALQMIQPNLINNILKLQIKISN